MGIRAKMSPAERAKQFMPFAALKGYEEALREKEKTVASRIEFSGKMKEEPDEKMRQIKRNDMQINE